MGVTPFVHHLYSDLADGLIIFQLYDIIKPGVVNWSRVKKEFHRMRMMMEKIGLLLLYLKVLVTLRRVELLPPIISGTDKATNFRFGRCIHSVHANKKTP